MIPRVLGADVSLTSTGLLTLDWDGGVVEALLVCPPKGMSKWDRLNWIVAQYDQVLARVVPALVSFEGYAMSQAQGLVGLVEVGTLLRWRTLQAGIPYVEPSTSALKKFATGKGNAPKDQVMMAVYKHWGYEAPVNDLSDAYVAARVGVHVMRPNLALTKERQEVLAKVLLTACGV